MCSVSAVIIGATIASTAISAYGQVQAGKAAQSEMNYRAAVAHNNAVLADRAAKDAIARGKLEKAQKAQETAQLLGRQRAVLAASGVDVNTGSALETQSQTAGIGRLDQLTITSNAQREALGFQTQGMNFEAQAGLNRLEGKNARSASLIQAGGTVLGGISTVASKWNKAFGTS